MAATFQNEGDGLYLLRIGGVLQRAELDAAQGQLSAEIAGGNKPRLLVLTDNFEGWERGADWNDVDYMLTQGSEIARIAIVGDPKWEAQALAFAGAGFRKAPVKFFPNEQEAAARAWLAE